VTVGRVRLELGSRRAIGRAAGTAPTDGRDEPHSQLGDSATSPSDNVRMNPRRVAIVTRGNGESISSGQGTTTVHPLASSNAMAAFLWRSYGP
jgi:hypothetical protein